MTPEALEGPTFSDHDFLTVRQLMKRRTGIDLSEKKRTLVYSRLSARVRALGLPSFGEYLERVGQESDEESTHFVNALTTNVTQFFREAHHFDTLKTSFLREVLARRQDKVRIWSAGCSTGQEPWTIAMTLASALKSATRPAVQIYATDIDTNVLAQAERGMYPIEEVAELPSDARRWLQRGTGQNQGVFRIGPTLRPMVRFRQVNLLEDWPLKPELDAIFCRNVVIYFDDQLRRKIVERFCRLLRPGGLLFLGHSETILANDLDLIPAGRTTYAKAGAS
jgi:chemotaxis protein methyltransferase CheR